MIYFLFAAIAALVVVQVTREWRHPDSTLLQEWAEENQLIFQSVKRCYLFHGPFRSDDGAVYKIVVEDKERNRREGWVSIPLGQRKKDRVVVSWDRGFISL